MKIFSELKEIKAENKKIVMAIGNFDGVHRGHKSIIRKAFELACENNGEMMVFTFKNHPLSIIAPKKKPLEISSLKIKREIFSSLGVELLLELTFTEEFAKKSTDDFINLIMTTISPFIIVVGENFTFGYKAEGNAQTLKKLCKEKGIEVIISPTVYLKENSISSTKIRELIKEGKILSVKEYLGYEFFNIGKVVHGDKRGRLLGFPTANITLGKNQAVLPDGVYAVKVSYQNEQYFGIANIGNNPTFCGKEKRLEVHIFNFSKEIYNEEIKVIYIEHIREEIKFPSLKELVKQIRKDKENAKKIFSLL